jgi:SAM-dependent methyltransferase
MSDNTGLFTSRADIYSKYRPSYPPEAINYLVSSCGLSRESMVADIGSGTGIFTKLLLDKAKTVYAVEPNKEMRGEAEKQLKKDRNFVSLDGTAEKIPLGAESVNMITAAQAFHLFDRDQAKTEFSRILRDGGSVILIWNKRLQNTDFLLEYENILQTNIPEYKDTTNSTSSPDMIKAFLGKGFKVERFGNNQIYDWDKVIGRLNSSSYMPAKKTDAYISLEKSLYSTFIRYAGSGKVQFNYSTEVYSGKLT